MTNLESLRRHNVLCFRMSRVIYTMLRLGVRVAKC